MDIVHSKDGTRIACDRTGAGPALVHVGGALNDRRSGAALAGLLAPQHTVLGYDRRGRGGSGDTPPYAVERDSAVMDDAATGAVLPEELLGRITVPALVVDGGASPGWMRGIARRAAALLPAGTHRTLEGQAHDADPGVLAPILVEFLAG